MKPLPRKMLERMLTQRRPPNADDAFVGGCIFTCLKAKRGKHVANFIHYAEQSSESGVAWINDPDVDGLQTYEVLSEPGTP